MTIAIVGMDARFPRAPNLAALWRLLLTDGDGIGEVPQSRWAVDEYFDAAGGPGRSNTRNAGFLDDADAFDLEFFSITPREAAAMDPQQRLLLQTAWRALEDATLDPRAVAGSRTGVFVGVMANEWANIHLSEFDRITAQHGSGNGYFMTANRLSYHLDLRGPSLAVDTACSSSLVAVQMACAALRRGECDQALAGGVNIVLSPALNIFYTQAGLSAPDGRCKPFSANADGIGRGEGVAVIVLRRLADAQAEGLPIYAVIEGGAVNSDGRSNGITAPSRWAQQQVLTDAYRDARIEPHQIDFIEAHGTGTVLGDMIEVKALGELHRSRRDTPSALGSIKGNLGHTEGAAGIAGLIKVVLSLHHGVLPPSRGAADQNPRLRLAEQGLTLAAAPMPLPERVVHAGVSSFGLGGTNAHVVLASAPEPGEPAEAATGMAGIVTLSANGLDGVRRAAARFADDLADRPDEQFAQLCWTSNRVKASGQHRLAVVAGDREQAISRLRTAAADDAALAAVTGLARPMSAGWLFTGQGSQYPGMFRPLYEASTAFRRELDAVDELLAAPLGASIRELMFADGEAIHGTGLAQPAIFAAEYATARVLADAGVAPSWLIGHSVGEYAAAAFAGVLDIADACALIVLRGRLMQQLPAGGSMLAVALDEAAASEAIAQLPQVSIAAVNGPRDVVVSGDGDALRRLQETLSTQGVTARPLTVSHAFHSPLMQPMVAAFAEAAAAVEFRPAQLPFYSTVRGRLLGVDEVIGADYWVEQITAPVRFAAAAAEALQADPTHVVEIGPRPILSPMLARIAPDATATRIAVCPGPSATGDELLEVVAALYRAGLDPRWDALYEPQARVRRRVSGYDFDTTQRFWVTAAGPEASARVPAVAGASAALPSPAPTHHSEDSTMDDLIALFREQNAIVASYLGDGQRPAMTAVPSAAARAVELVAAPPAATPAAPAVTAAQIAAAVRAEAARVSGFSPERLLDTQTLSGDLGLDSIMIADLATGLGRTLAGISVEPGSILADGTLGDLIERLAEQVMSAPAPAAAPPAAPPPPAPAPELPRARRTGVVAEDRIEEFPEVVEIAERLAGVRALGLENPYFLVNDGIAQDTSIIDGVEVINFSSFNYLGMSGHPAVVAATQEAVGRYGTSVSSSRLLSGEKPIHQSLEAELAALLGTDDSIALTSGHATNVTVIGHVISPDDLVIHDALAHNSIVEGAVLSGATRRPFPHNDAAALDEILTATRQQYRRALIVIEGIYSQDGDIADLPAIIAVKKKHGALLMIDEAHSLGVLGATGAGVGEHFGVDRADVELWSGTLSKSLASCGGYVASSHATIQFLKYTTPGFIFSTGMSPANAAAALAALRQMQAEPEVLAVLAKNSELFLQLAKEAGIDTGISAGTPVVPCILGDSLKTLTLSRALLARGINVNPILYPAVPEHLARLRFFLTASHTEDQIRYTVATLVSEIAAAS